MSDWNNNNLACTTTWSTLLALDQLKETFKDSGKMKMQELTFWSNADSGPMRDLKVAALATQMDKIFTMITGAKYEENKSKDGAIQDIRNIMTTADKTVSDLATTNDDNYLFWREVKQ